MTTAETAAIPAGVLVIHKPIGLTSHDVIQRIRRRLGIRRVGHAGTLDPDASGVLVVCIQEATRILEYLVSDEKVYEGTVVFGIQTDTDDAAGTMIRSEDASWLQAESVTACAASFTGSYEQQVPAYSAVHIAGKRAYEWARAGEDKSSDLPFRTVTIQSLSVSAFSNHNAVHPMATFRVHCSKGTYIRSVCRDWGERLGTCAHLASLCRTESGRFTLASAVPLEAFEGSDDPLQWLIPLEHAIAHLPRLVLERTDCTRLANGRAIQLKESVTSGIYAVYDTTGDFWLIGQGCASASAGAELKPKKVFVRQ